MIHRLPRRMPGMIPCSNIEYTASRPISNRREISDTDMRGAEGVNGHFDGNPEFDSATGSDMALLARSIVFTMGAALGTNTRFGSIRISDDVGSGLRREPESRRADLLQVSILTPTTRSAFPVVSLSGDLGRLGRPQ